MLISKEQPIKKVNFTGDYPLSLPKLARSVPREAWQTQMDTWYFDFRTVLMRHKDILEDQVNDSINRLDVIDDQLITIESDTPTAGLGLYQLGASINVGSASSTRIVVTDDYIDLAATAVSPGTYGSSTQVGMFTVDSYGRIIGATNTPISHPVIDLAHNILSPTHTDSLTDTVIRGDVLVGNIAALWSRLAKGAANTVLRADASDVVWGSVVLTTDVTGTLPIGNGGTGQVTVIAAFNALSPLTTRGDVLTRDATNNVRLGIGVAATYLRSNGTDPAWAALAAADITGVITVPQGGTGAATLTGIVQGNAALAMTAITGTANYIPKWSATAPYLTGTSLIFDSGSNVGIGEIVPASKLHVTVDDATTNAITTVARFYHTTTGIPANGIGGAIQLGGERTGGTAVGAVSLQGIVQDVSDVSANAGTFLVQTRRAGTLTTSMALSGSGGLSVGDATATMPIGVINAVTGYRVAGVATASRVLRSDATNFVPGQVVLTTDVTGILPIANGGTNQTAFSSLGVVYFNGTSLINGTDLLYAGGTLTTGITTGTGVLSAFYDVDGLAAGVLQLNNLSNVPGSSAASIQATWNLSTSTSVVDTALAILAGKEQEWTGVSSTLDSYASFLTLSNSTLATALNLRSSGSIICGKDSTLLSRTDDFLYACPVAGVPTGVPTTFGSRIAIAPDSVNRAISYYAGAWYQHSRRNITSSTTQQGNTALTETDLFTISVSAGTGTIDGCSLDFISSGTFATSLSADKRIRCYWAGVLIFDSGNLNITVTSDWAIYGNVIRVDATNFKAVVTLNTSSASLSAYADYSTGASTWANANTLKITGQGTNASDVAGELWKVGYEM